MSQQYPGPGSQQYPYPGQPTHPGPVSGPTYQSYSAPGPAPQGPQRPAATPPENNLATGSLVVGIISVFLSLLFVPAIVGLILGIIGVIKAGRTNPPVGKGQAIAGIVLSVVALVLGIGLVSAISSAGGLGASEAARVLEETVGDEHENGGDAGAVAAEGDEPHADPANFQSIDASAWDLIARDPDDAEGETIVVFAEVTQFDAATGTDTFRANVGADRPAAEFELETNTILSGEAAVLDEVVAGDILKVHAVVAGAVDYDTQLGGSTTVPLLAVAKVENIGFADLSKDVKIGKPARDEFGYVKIEATITNSGAETFTYSVEVVAESKDGATSYGTGSGFAESLKPGQKATVSVDFFDDVPADAVFRVGPVDRYGN